MPDFDQEFPPLGAPSRGQASKESDEEWQLISTGDEDDQTENDVSSTGEERETKTATVIIQGNPKFLRHSASSPDLRVFDHILGEEEENDEDKVEDSSFSMVSNGGSVVSMASGRSFRDAFLSSPVKEDKVDESEPTAHTTNTSTRGYRKPKKIVVTQPSTLMRRCSKSSPNLLGLIHEHDDEIVGETDAIEFYHRKSKGAQGRANGLKLRPDEAKRKAFAVNKRNMQRQGK